VRKAGLEPARPRTRNLRRRKCRPGGADRGECRHRGQSGRLRTFASRSSTDLTHRVVHGLSASQSGHHSVTASSYGAAMSRATKYTMDVLEPAVAASQSIAGVLRYLGLAQAGGTQAHIASRIRALGIDTSHFRRSTGGARSRLTTQDILERIPYGSMRRKPHHLRWALTSIGRPYQCAKCSNEGLWRGAALRLHVDHVDGDFHNNDPGNLRFLCPNCHSQTATFAGRHKGSYPGRQRPQPSGSASRQRRL
jgi:hypothetical protein